MRILLVDDEPLVLNDSEDIIRSVMPAEEIIRTDNAKDAIALANEKIDIAFLDVEMPHKNGLELAKELQSIQPDIDIIFVTGYPQYALDSFKLHACDYIIKLLDEGDVLHAIKSLRNSALKNKRKDEFIDRMNNGQTILREEVLDEFNKDLRIQCPKCNQSHAFEGVKGKYQELTPEQFETAWANDKGEE